MEYKSSIMYDGKIWTVLLRLECNFFFAPEDQSVGFAGEEGIDIEVESFECYCNGDDATWFIKDDAEVIVKADYNNIWKQWRKENE